MKKLSKIMAICLAFVLVFALAACGDNSNQSTPDSDTVKGEKVENVEAFAKIFDFSGINNLTIKNSRIRDDITITSSGYISYAITADKYYVIDTKTGQLVDGTIETEINEQYVAQEGDVAYEYYKEDGKWYKSETNDSFDATVLIPELIQSVMHMFFIDPEVLVANYENFRFDEDKSIYILNEFESSGDGLFERYGEEVQIKIIGGKLSEMTYIEDEDEMWVLNIYDIGNTTVTLPNAELIEE